jgi:UDPglucose 6-dehydrogenase
MKVTIFGSGYVGLVTGACLADVGNHVVCVDIDKEKVDNLNNGLLPIYEPGLQEIVVRNRDASRLVFTTDMAHGVAHGLFQFIAVGTPPDEDGSADLQHVLAVARTIGEMAEQFKVIVNKSTVPVGTADLVAEEVARALNERDLVVDFDVVSNPEFLKEGAAIADFMKPERIVVGTDDPRTLELIKTLYEPFNRKRDRLVAMDVRSSELTKYAANAMLATKISFMNELANLAERVGADIENVRIGIGSDPRIGYHFIYPGCGYGGSCFPKDVKALAHTAESVGIEPYLLNAVEEVNKGQKNILFEKISHYFKGILAGRTVAIWGLSFKPNTDDMREASSCVLMEALWAEGAIVRAYDPEACGEVRRIYGERDDLILCEDQDSALEGADCLAIVTEWREFRSPDFEKIEYQLKTPVIFDGRNLYDPGFVESQGIEYYGIGRGRSVRSWGD